MLEIGLSKEPVRVTKDTLERVVKERLPSGSGAAPLLLPYDKEATFLLQKWSPRWQAFVDFSSAEEIFEGDRLKIVEKSQEVRFFFFDFGLV